MFNYLNGVIESTINKTILLSKNSLNSEYMEIGIDYLD